METKDDFYTIEQAAEILNRTRSTIYKYIQQGKIKPKEDHKWRMLPGTLIPKAQIDELATMQEEKKGYSFAEAADILGIHRTTVKRLADEGRIPYFKSNWRGREVSFINKEDLNTFKEQNQGYLDTERLKRRDFYLKDKNLGFYQKFLSPAGLEARLLVNEKRKLKFLFPNTKEVISYEEGIYKYELTPAYKLTSNDMNTSPGVAYFKLPRFNSFTFSIIDSLYSQSSISNLYMDHLQEDYLSLYVKNLVINDILYPVARFLDDHIQKGSCYYNEENQILSIESDVESLMVHLPKGLKDSIKQIAETQKISMQELAKRILEEGVNSYK